MGVILSRLGGGWLFVFGFGGVFATLQEHAADDNDVDRQDHHDFEVKTGFAALGLCALRDQGAWSIHNFLGAEYCFVEVFIVFFAPGLSLKKPRSKEEIVKDENAEKGQ